MATTPFGYGNSMYQDLPFYELGGGIQTEFGTLLPPGSRVAAYVRGDGTNILQSDLDPRPLRDQLVPSLAAGLARARASKGDVVYVLPGHNESVTDATMLANLQAGTKIRGLGRGAFMPVFRWTNTAGQWVFNKNDCEISGLRLRMEGANGIVKAIAWTGADCAMFGNDIEVASGAALKATIAIELATGADRCVIAGNEFRGTETHNVTNGVLVSNAIVGFKFLRNVGIFSATAANGLLNINAAALRLFISGNQLYNTMTASTAAINVSNAASDGIISDNYLGVLNNGTASSQGLVLGAASLVKCFQNFCDDQPILSGILAPVAAT